MLLEIPDTVTGSYIKELASALKQVSVILALQVLLKGNVPIRETFGIAAYRDVIGQDAIIEMMTTNEREGKKTEDRKHFLLEDGVSCVHIALNSNISGINNFYEMADEKKLRTGRVHLDKNKIPEIGTYFAGTRYIDLFVNWYIRNHMGDTNNDSDLRSLLWYLGSILSPSTYTPNVAASGMSGEENISYSSPSRKEPVPAETVL